MPEIVTIPGMLANPHKPHKTAKKRPTAKRNPEGMLFNPKGRKLTEKLKRWILKLKGQGRAIAGIAKLTHVSESEITHIGAKAAATHARPKRKGGKKHKAAKRPTATHAKPKKGGKKHKAAKRPTATHAKPKKGGHKKAGHKKAAKRPTATHAKPKRKGGKKHKAGRRPHVMHLAGGWYAKINPSGASDIGPMVLGALMVALGFLLSRALATQIRKRIPIGFLKNDLVSRAIPPLLITFLPKRWLRNQKAALASGAYLQFVLFALDKVLPTGVKGAIEGYTVVSGTPLLPPPNPYVGYRLAESAPMTINGIEAYTQHDLPLPSAGVGSHEQGGNLPVLSGVEGSEAALLAMDTEDGLDDGDD